MNKTSRVLVKAIILSVSLFFLCLLILSLDVVLLEYYYENETHSIEEVIRIAITSSIPMSLLISTVTFCIYMTTSLIKKKEEK